ncbi:MAG: hypothetical protein Rhims3KO_13680 [Hyphomicrobiales bacterium]
MPVVVFSVVLVVVFVVIARMLAFAVTDITAVEGDVMKMLFAHMGRAYRTDRRVMSMSSQGLNARLGRSVACLLTLIAAPTLASDGAVALPDFGTQLTIPANSSGSLEFAHPAYDGAMATVRIENGRVVAGTDNDALTLATYDPHSQWNDEMAVLLMDVDFDGYQDVGVLDGVGYGGVNYFWSFHRADAQRGFVPMGTIANPQRDDIMGTILSDSRSGPNWSRDVYRAEGNALNLQFSRTFWGEYDVVVFPGTGKGDGGRAIISQIAPDPWDVASLNDPMFHVTAVSANSGRAYFYDAPNDSTRRGAYLVQGDVGRVLDVDATGEWYEITFTHHRTGNTTQGWMRAVDMTIIQG